MGASSTHWGTGTALLLFLCSLTSLWGLACAAPIQTYPGQRLSKAETARVDFGDLEATVKVDGNAIAGSAAEVMPGPHRVSGYGQVKNGRYKVAASFTAVAGGDYTARVFWTAKRRDADEPLPHAGGPVEVTPVLLIEDANRGGGGYRVVDKSAAEASCGVPVQREQECPDAI